MAEPTVNKVETPAQPKKTPAVKKEPKNKVAKTAKEENNGVSSGLNAFLWLLSAVIICAAIFGNYYYTKYVIIDESSLQRLARVAVVIVAIAAGLVVLLFTSKGRQLLSFARLSYTELRKVVWPTRQEALQTTFIVFVAVCIVSLFLYLCDIVFLQLVRSITL